MSKIKAEEQSWNCVKPPTEIDVTASNLSEQFDNFKADYEVFLQATSQEDLGDAVLVARMLLAIGPEVRYKYRERKAEVPTQSKKWKQIIDFLKGVFVQTESKVCLRHKFWLCVQLEGEKFDEYLSRLRVLVKVCEYGTLSEELLCDQIVLGINNDSVRKALLEREDVNLNDAIRTCRVRELTEKQLNEMTTTSKVYRVPRGTNDYKKHNERKVVSCKFCGREHEMKKEACPAFGKSCLKCGQPNHFRVKCIGNLSKKVKEIRHKVNSETDEEWDDWYHGEVSQLRQVTSADNTKDLLYELKFLLNGKASKVKVLIDTGAQNNCVGYSYLKKLVGEDIKKIKTSKKRLEDFSGNKIEVLGEYTIRCIHRGKKYDIIFQVTKTNHRFLLSKTTIFGMQLIQVVRKTNSTEYQRPIKSAKNIVDKYAETVKYAKNLIAKAETESKSLWNRLSNQRNTPNKVGSSPSQRMVTFQEKGTEKIEQRKSKSKECYDKRTRDLEELKMGQTVTFKRNAEMSKEWSPGRVVSRTENRSHLVEANDRKYRCNREHIKPYSESEEFHPEIATSSNVEKQVTIQEAVEKIENTEENTVTEMQASRPPRDKQAPA